MVHPLPPLSVRVGAPSEETINTHSTRSPDEIAVLVFQVNEGVHAVLLVVELTAVARRTTVGKATAYEIRIRPVLKSFVGMVSVKLPAVTVCEPKVNTATAAFAVLLSL